MNAAETLAAIEALRANEGDSVTLIADDPEAVSVDRQCAIDCSGDWTVWADRRFYGATIAEALAAAVKARKAAEVE